MIQTEMTQCKKSIKNGAILRNITPYKPVLYQKTICSGKKEVIKRFILIHDSFVEPKDNNNSSFEMNSTTRFLNQVKKYQKLWNVLLN